MGSSSAEPHGADATAVMPSSPPVAATGCDGRKATQVRGDADRADARAAAAVRHGEGLVEVEVADVRRRCSPDWSDRPARSCWRRPCRPVRRRRVRRRRSRGCGSRRRRASRDRSPSARTAPRRVLRPWLRGPPTSMLPLVVARHRHDLHAGHGGRRGVRAVGRRGDQHDVAVALPAALVVGADDHQPRVFARGARIGLQRAGREAR